ncbi:unnamed protein product [Tilletia controversa]|nr:unnamed protein product [Tilletia controversa]CAD6897266.1 unnamed protein product [Tilletia controversa]CAD6921961.1 unnamed protein product [Tilletia controversa]
MSSSAPQSFVLQEVAALAGHNVRKIASGLEYACAITDEERIFVWGLDSRFGRLGLRLGDRPGSAQVDLRVFQPREVSSALTIDPSPRTAAPRPRPSQRDNIKAKRRTNGNGVRKR